MKKIEKNSKKKNKLEKNIKTEKIGNIKIQNKTILFLINIIYHIKIYLLKIENNKKLRKIE